MSINCASPSLSCNRLKKGHTEETIHRPESCVGSVWSKGRFISNASEERMYKSTINIECNMNVNYPFSRKKKHAHPSKNVTNLHFFLKNRMNCHYELFRIIIFSKLSKIYYCAKHNYS